MTRAGQGWFALTGVVMVACAQIINADFDDLKPRSTSSAAGMGGSGEGGMAGAGGTDTGAAGDVPDADSSSSAGGASGSGGLGGAGGSSPEASAGAAGSREAGPDVVADSSDARVDGEADRSVNDGPTDVTADHADAVVPTDAPITGGVVINEIKGVGPGPDWIELYNPGQMPMVLDGYVFAQATGATGPPDLAGAVTFPQGTTIDGGTFLMVVAQQATVGGPTTACQALATSCFTVTWGVSSSGERIYLLYPADGGASATLDQVDYPASVVAGQTWARAANGTYQAAAPTPNQPNGI